MIGLAGCMATGNDYRSMSRAALEGSLARAEGKVERQKVEGSRTMEVIGRTVGAVVTGPVSAGLVGYLETRFPQKDGTRLSIGPVPLPVFIGGLATVGTFIPGLKPAANQLAHVASSNFGLASGTLARGYGAVHLAKAKAKEKKGEATKGVDVDPLQLDETQEGFVGDDEREDWTPEERKLLGAA